MYGLSTSWGRAKTRAMRRGAWSRRASGRWSCSEATGGLWGLTDRDQMFHCIAEGRDATRTPVEEIIAAPVVLVPESLPIEDALVRMAETRVRRLAVVDPAGCLAGVLALDDVLELLSEEFGSIARLLKGSG